MVTAKSKNLLYQTPSMANIHKSSVNLEVDNGSPRSPAGLPKKDSLYTPGGVKFASLNRKRSKRNNVPHNKVIKRRTATNVKT